MARVFVPIHVGRNQDFEKIIENLKKVKADRVYLALGDRMTFERCSLRSERLKRLKEMDGRLKKEGFETAAWIATCGYGGQVPYYNKELAKDLHRRTSIMGKTLDDSFCPYDEKFINIVCDYIEDIAKTGIDAIMLDDELIQSVLPGIGCACELHMSEYQKRLGEKIERKELAEKLFTGKSNRYRDVWIDLMGETLNNFCKRLREAADKINPNIRMGFCASCTSWDFEGIDAVELFKTLAGKNKPFLRFTGAPYWYSYKRFGLQSLQNIIECVRQQYQWAKESGAEVFTEADPYPHNRHQTPACYVELFDLATRVSDDMDCLKYMMGYYAEPWYDMGYINKHTKNLKLYDEIKAVFNDKKPTGIRIYEEMRTIKGAELPNEFVGEDQILSRWFQQASIIPTSVAIPTTYENETGIFGMAFAENARYLPQTAFEKGLVIDLKAAEILQEKGIDVGLLSSEKIEGVVIERFDDYGTRTYLLDNAGYDINIKDKARALSWFEYEDKTTPAVYLYENTNGQRFMVYAIRIEEMWHQSGMLLSYCRGIQLNDCAKWLGGEDFPVVCNNNPMLYCICKENEKKTAAAYFNCHPDEIENAEIKVRKKAENVRFMNCSGHAENDRIIIDYIKPYGFAAIEFDRQR